MAHLHLPTHHEAADIVLAHRIGQLVESGELYVTWTHAAGPGQRPDVHAHVRETGNPIVEAVAHVLGWISGFLDAIVPPHRTAVEAGRDDARQIPAPR